MNYEDLPKGSVLCRGCFDVLHIGHIKHLLEASKLGEVIVCVTPDRYAGRKLRFHELERVKHLEMIGYKAAVSPHPTAAEDIREKEPSHFCKGREFEGIYDEIKTAEACHVQIAFVGEKIASSRALRDEV